jgi:hypothetical protein
MNELTLAAIAAIGIIVAILAAGAAVRYRRRARSAAAELDSRSRQAASERDSLRAKIDSLSGQANALRAGLNAKAAGIGQESNAALAYYFRALSEQIALQIEELDRAREVSAKPFLAAEEAQHRQVQGRKQDFARYRDVLLTANLKIRDVSEQLKADREFIERLLNLLNSERLNPAMGNLEVRAMMSAIDNIDALVAKDLQEEITATRTQAEIDHLQKMRDRLYELERKDQEETPPNKLRVMKDALKPEEE